MALRCGQDGRDSQREVSNSERFRRLGSIGLRLGGRGSGSGPVLGALLHIQYFTTLERFLSVIGRRRRTMWRIPRTSQHSLAGLVALWRCGALLGKRTDSFIRSASSRSIRCKVCMLCVYECRCMYACLLPHPSLVTEGSPCQPSTCRGCIGHTVCAASPGRPAGGR